MIISSVSDGVNSSSVITWRYCVTNFYCIFWNDSRKGLKNGRYK